MKPLANRRIVITRPPHKAQDMAERIRALGGDPVLMPTIAIDPAEDTAPLDAALHALTDYDWVLFTSPNTVKQVWARFEALAVEPELPRVATVGPATARALQKRGVTVDLIAERHVAEGLFESLNAAVDLDGLRILLPQSQIARPVLADLLRGAGAEVTAVTAYRTAQPGGEIPPGPFDAVTFTSSSTAENFAEMVTDPAALISGSAVVCIGPITAETCRSLGWEVTATADPHTIDGLLDALVATFQEHVK